MESKTGICKEKYNVAPPCTALRTIYFMAEDNSMFFGRPIFFSDDGHRSYNPPARGGKLNDFPLSLLRIYKHLDLTCLAIRSSSRSACNWWRMKFLRGYRHLSRRKLPNLRWLKEIRQSYMNGPSTGASQSLLTCERFLSAARSK